MAISSSTSRNQYTANGSNTTFAYSFKVFDDDDLDVYVDNTLKSKTTDYSVTGVGNASGGNIIFTTAPANAAIVTIVRDEPFVQEIEYVEGDDFPAAAHEEGLDRSLLRDLTLKETLDRALTIPVTSSLTTVELPTPEANTLLGWNGDATELVNVTLNPVTTGNTSIAGTLSATGAVAFDTTLSVAGLTTLADVKIIDSINDTNNNEVIKIGTTGSAVNEITVTNAATGAGATISATGDDTNIDLNLQAKGTGAYNFKATSTAASKIKLFEDTDNGTNSIAFKAPDSIASDVTFTVPSGDGSSGQSLITNGSGVLSFASGRVVQVVESFSSSSDSTTSLIPYDNTIPQNTEGKEYTVTNLVVTPLYANSILLIEYVGWLGSDTNTDQILALFVDSTADAIAASVGIIPSANRCGRVGDIIKVNSGSTTARTYKLRYGGRVASTTYIGGPSGGPIMGGVMKSGIRVTEIL